ETLVEPFAQARAALDFLALVVAVILPLLDRLGHRLAGNVRLHDGLLFDHGDALAHFPHFGLGLLDRLVHPARLRHGDGFALVSSVLFLVGLGLVDRTLALIRFRDPFLDADLFGRTGGRTGSRGATIAGPDGDARRGQDRARQQSETQTLPDHCLFSFDAEHADPEPALGTLHALDRARCELNARNYAQFRQGGKAEETRQN